MFYLYHHNDLGRLAELFSVLRARYRSGPLATDTVLVPNQGMGRWLSIQLAESDGIVSNLRSALPGGYIWELLQRVSPSTLNGEHFEAHALPWHLYLALPVMAQDIAAVAHYLGTPLDEVRRWQLARELAAVFDKYLVYRADMLASWEHGETPTQDPGRWQAQVWRYLTRDEHLGGNHRAQVLRDFVARLRADHDVQQRIADHCPRHLYCFGLMVVAPDHLRLLYALARHIDVHFLLPNPSAVYWGDVTTQSLPLTLPDTQESATALPGEMWVESEHALLGTLGRMARDTLRVFYSDEFSGMIEPQFGDAMAYYHPGHDCLLHRIQTGIVTLDCSNPAQGMSDHDTSLEIHACHSPLREVQVLQDQLLDRLASDDTRAAGGDINPDQRLAPRDIIVMMPDVSAYAPAIKAVFGGAPPERYLPFGLADRARSATHPIMTCFASLMDLPLSRWQASELLDLLAVPAVMQRFNLTAGEVDNITSWIREAGVRWGRDGDHRKQLGAGAFEQNSWRFGLDRLLLGVTQSDDETLVDQVAPWSDLEGHATAALGKLWRFERTLSQAAQTLAQAATPGQWQARLNQLLDDLLAPAADNPDEQRAVDSLRQLFANFDVAEQCTQSITLNSDRRVSWQAVRDMLLSHLQNANERQPFLTGGITFCGMVPLRAVPFRVICVLGLNDGAFPRQDTGRAFNVMFQRPRLGDRNIRDDDRLLFLQALTAARDTFYISYVGQDVNSGEELQPSPIVGETLQFVHQHYFRDWSHAAFRERLIHHQPMQPFSSRYFTADDTTTADARVFTYAANWRAATRAAFGKRRQLPAFVDGGSAAWPEAITAIDLITLKRFFDHPPRAFFRDRLQLRLDIDQDAVADDEPVTLSALAAALLRQRLFESAKASDDEQLALEPTALERARGQLPPPPLANANYALEAEAVNALLPTWQSWRAQARPVSIDIDLPDINGLRVTGRVNQLWPRALRRLRSGRLRTKFRLRYWIDYLAVVAAGHEVALEIVGFENKKGSRRMVQYGGKISAASARSHLAALLQLYLEGQQQPLPYHPDLDDEYVASQNKAFKNFSHRFHATAPYPHYLTREPYFALLLGAAEAPLGPEQDNPFIATIDAVSAPMNAAIRPCDQDKPR